MPVLTAKFSLLKIKNKKKYLLTFFETKKKNTK